MGLEDKAEGSSAMLRVHPSWVTSPTMLGVWLRLGKGLSGQFERSAKACA